MRSLSPILLQIKPTYRRLMEGLRGSLRAPEQLTIFYFTLWVKTGLDTQIRAYARIQQQRRHFNHLKSRISRRKHGVAEVKQRLKQALRSAMSNDSDKTDQVTSLTFLTRALRADLGDRSSP